MFCAAFTQSLAAHASCHCASSYPRLRVACAALLAGALVLFVARCDTTAPASEPEAAHALRLSPIPPGGRLLKPSADSKSGSAYANALRRGGPEDAPEGASPYGCLFSSPAPEQGEDLYRYDAVYLHFPRRVVEAAGGEMELVRFQMTSASLYAGAEREEASIVRMASCRIPKTPEARQMVCGRLEAFRRVEDADWKGMSVSEYRRRLASEADSSDADGSDASRLNAGGSSLLGNSLRAGESDAAPPGSRGMECVEITVVCFCYTGALAHRGCEVDEVYCSAYEYVSDPPGGGGGGGLPGEDPGDCNYEGGPTDQLCYDDPGGGGAVPPPPPPDTTTTYIKNPCERANPPAYCDDAGSCFGKNISDEYDCEVLRDLENQGMLNELWQKSNADAQDQSQRQERGGWIVQNDDGSYSLVEFHEVENDITYLPLGIRGVSTGNRPSGTVATFHTQPFKPGEIITDS